MRSLYKPRDIFMPYHMRAERWAVLVAHRRAGKTVAAVNDIVEKATYNPRENPRYAYLAPMYRQAKDIAWDYLKFYASPFNPKISESELSVILQALPNRPKITLYGADNPDSFRGMYFDGVTLDEFGNMKYSVWKEVLLPALVDRRGWATFMGTPNGPNHFRDMHYEAMADAALGAASTWHHSFLPVEPVSRKGHIWPGTHLIPQEELAMMKKIMDEEQYQQEMLCNFEASVRGAIYARQIEQMENEGRIADFSSMIQRDQPTHTVMDLGFRDDNPHVYWQDKPDGVLVTHAFSANMRPLSFHIAYRKDYYAKNKLRVGQLWLPHDARARSLQTGISIVEQWKRAKVKKPRIVPELDLMDGISATRLFLRQLYLHEPETQDLVMALKSYHRKYDEDKKIYSDEPVHDWSSHYADTTRYLALAAQRTVKHSPPPEDNDRMDGMAHTGTRRILSHLTLEQLFKERDQGARRERI